MIKKRIYKILNFNDENDKIDVWFDRTILLLIILTTVSIVLDSFKGLRERYGNIFKAFDLISIGVFTIEYLLRIWTADLKYPESNKFIARIRYMFSFMALIDLMAILPFYLPNSRFDLRFLRMIRAFRLFGIFKLTRYTKALSLITKVIKDTKHELMTTIFILLFIVMVSSTMIYYIETDVQPDKFPNIVASFWWAIATLTTVGYGDVFPLTGPGKFLASIVAVSGIGFVALPTGIISTGFMEEIKLNREKTKNGGLKNERCTFPAIIHFDGKGYLVRFHDFDECYSYADTIEKATDGAIDKLNNKIIEIYNSGKGVPIGSKVDEVIKNKDDIVMLVCIK